MSINTNKLPLGHELVEGQTHHAVIVYGNATCPDTLRSRALLEGLGIEYNFYDIELDAAIARTADALRGEGHGAKIPVINLGEGYVLVEPSDDELTATLTKTGRLHAAG
ncbi:MAG: NrdH-redoxin [Cytophagales bacterium]|nr:NrdH-redoxin [Armatimonadota bacterium]